MSPGLSREDGTLRIRIMKGLELTPRQLLAVLVALGVLFSIPDITRNTGQSLQLGLFQKGVVFGLAALGLNLLLRHAELVSFGHAAFFGTGAYTVAILINKLDVQSFAIMFVAALVVATLVSALIGFFTLHHTGLYFALVTLAFGQVLFSIPKGVRELGGTDGLSVLTGESGVPLAQQRPTLGGIQLSGGDIPATILFWLSCLVLLVGLLVMLRIAKSPFGRALDAIGQERTRAKFLGLPVRRYVWAAFIISGIYGGAAGALFAVAQGSVLPEQTLNVFVSGDILYMAILGGFDTLVGPVIGGLLFENLTTLADQIAVPSLAGGTLTIGRAVTGFVFLVVVFAFPKGIVGSLKQGGNIRNIASTFVSNPAVIGEWAVGSVYAIGNAFRRAGATLRILIFGVN